MEMPQIHRPVARRGFEITPPSPDTSDPPTPASEDQNPGLLMSRRQSDRSPPPSRTRSILNLTSSTLLGIYSGATDGGRGEELNTPWGTGAQTPSHSARPSIDIAQLGQQLGIQRAPTFPFNFDKPVRDPKLFKGPKRGFKNYYLPLISQTVMLFGCGMGFGSLLTHLDKTQPMTPIPVPTDSNNSFYYQIAWGLLGVMLGNALPQIDIFFDDDEDAVTDGFAIKPDYAQRLRRASTTRQSMSGKDRPSLTDSGLGPIWYSTVRSIGAFVGIAYALRKLHWQSTLQVSLTLATANPVLWYLIDRSKPGFALSLIVSLGGALLTLLFNPSFVPVPEIYQEQPSERLGVFLWLASILFCTSLCFGAIGRRLQL